MNISKFEQLPKKMQNVAVKQYYDIVKTKQTTLTVKHIIDVLICGIIFIITLPFFITFSVLIKLTSTGPVLFKQERIGKDLKTFHILKFRTMVKDADKKGIQLTTGNDSRITPFGKFLRGINMDEMPQLINVIKGDMSIIGTRPEVKRYVDVYTDEMLATLLIKPGMVSLASVKYKNENDMLTLASNPEQVYIDDILPDKMKYNLEYLSCLSLKKDFLILGKTIACVFK
ncbi:MAG: sugar transferase [Oscillospiraceae bacterium]